MQINRLFGIIYLLMEGRNMTAKALAEHFEVSARTILRDVDVLSMAGIPIYTVQGKGGGIALLDQYVLNKAVLSEAEQNHILFALQGLAATRQLDAGDVLDRLEGLFAKSNANGSKWIFPAGGIMKRIAQGLKP